MVSSNEGDEQGVDGGRTGAEKRRKEVEKNKYGERVWIVLGGAGSKEEG